MTAPPYRPGDPWVVDPEDRTTFYGATDIARILGVSHFGGPIEVMREKVHKLVQPGSSRARWGLLLEQAICDGYSETTGYALRWIRKLQHPTVPYIIGHPDRLVGRVGLMDAKATERRDDYGEAGTSDVPPHVRVQMTVYMGLARRQWADVAVLAGTTRGLDIFRVPAEAPLYDAAIEACVEFHERYVLRGEEPEPDGSHGWSQYVAARYPHDNGLEMPPATAEQMLWLDELRVAIEAVDVAETQRDRAIQRIQRSMKHYTLLPTIFGSVSWKAQKPATRWKVVANTLALAMAEAQLATTEGAVPILEAPGVALGLLADVIAADKAGRSGPRVFRHPFHVKHEKDEEP